MKKKFLAVFLVWAMVLSFTACGGDTTGNGKDTYDLKFSFAGGEGMRTVNIWFGWQDKITEATEGKVTFTNYYDSTLLDANSEITQLKSGIADIGDVHKLSSDGFKMFEKWKGITMGTPVEAQVEMTQVLIDQFPELQEELSEFKVIANAMDGGTYQLLTTKKQVASVSDMKGMVIWCEADFNDYMKALGATPVNTPWSEVYSSLQKNMYDGLLIAAETLQSNNFAEVCQYITKVNLNYLAGPGHLMCLDTWNSLPKTVQEAIDDPEIRGYIENEQAESGHKTEASSIQWAQENHGVEVIELSEAEQQKFIDILNSSKKSIASDWDKQGLPGTELLDKIIELSANYE